MRVRQDLPAGRNLQDHLRVGLAFESRLPALDSQLTPAAFTQFAADGCGPVSSNVGETSGFIRSRPEHSAPDLQINGVPAMIGGMLGVVADGAVGRRMALQADEFGIPGAAEHRSRRATQNRAQLPDHGWRSQR